MPKLKKLRLQGFKSFDDPLELVFPTGITAVFGPVGSVKSNVADAIRWVLGEQRITTLRGSTNEDMIFAGSYDANILVKASCSTDVISDTLFEFALTASYAPDTTCTPDTTCWNSISATRADDVLTSQVDYNHLLGTPFAAPSTNNNPTAITLNAFGATSPDVLLPVAGLLVGVATIVIFRRKQR